MNDQTSERVEEWDSRPVSGLDGVRELADGEFSGAVYQGSTGAFLLNGRVVGVFGGDLDDFETGATAAAAPHDSLPLLLAMQERGGERQARYYTNDTPLEEVDETLSDANFTGYVELSENVLSGDYHLVYHGGNRMSVAFVGASEELKTDGEAWELATDEVGIYEVVRVDVDVKDVPEPQTAGAAGVSEAESGDGPAPAASAEPETEPEPEAETETGTTTPPVTEAESTTESTEPVAEAESEPDPSPPDSGADESVTSEATRERSASGPDRPDADDRGDAQTSAASSSSGEADEDDDPFVEEEEWRETVSIPAVAPDESADGAESASQDATGQTAAASTGQTSTGATRERSTSGADRGRARELQAELEERTEELRTVRERLDDVAAERDGLRTERDELRAERERLQSELDDIRAEASDLRSQLERARSSGTHAGDGPVRESLTPAEALDGTDLFVRYDSRGKPTLDDVAGGADASEVTANLRLDHHTQFESDGVHVDGTPFEAFLHDSVEYGFVNWLVEELPFEIRDTGHEAALEELYAAIPEVDRVELHGEVEVEAEGGVERRTFDVVVRDRMGTPLVVADLNGRLEPVSGDMMEQLVDASEAVASGESSVAGAVYVTTSFFEPDALEVAQDATSGGFLSRDRRASFVKTGRKRGYHLCLVETRDGEFYLNVPEL